MDNKEFYQSKIDQDGRGARMTTHQGLLAITKDTPPEDYEQLTSISGTLYVCKGATATMPQLTSISGTLYVREGATATMPQLTSTGTLYVREGATATMPQLTSISGTLYVREGATATMPQLTSITRYLEVYEGATFTRPKLTSIYGVKGRLLALHEYPLWLGEDGLYRSGCRGPWTREQALAHWGQPNRTDDRALAFVAAIEGAQA